MGPDFELRPTWTPSSTCSSHQTPILGEREWLEQCMGSLCPGFKGKFVYLEGLWRESECTRLLSELIRGVVWYWPKLSVTRITKETVQAELWIWKLRDAKNLGEHACLHATHTHTNTPVGRACLDVTPKSAFLICLPYQFSIILGPLWASVPSFTRW